MKQYKKISDTEVEITEEKTVIEGGRMSVAALLQKRLNAIEQVEHSQRQLDTANDNLSVVDDDINELKKIGVDIDIT